MPAMLVQDQSFAHVGDSKLHAFLLQLLNYAECPVIQPEKMGTSSDRLRALAKDATDKNLLSTAAFFWEKVICLEESKQPDVFALAQLYFRQSQFRRALQTLERIQTPRDRKSRLLAGHCLAECKEWDACLAMLGEEDSATSASATSPMDTDDSIMDIDVGAACCLLRGKVYDSQQNRAKAAYWYQESLRRDVHCVEAFERLADNHMLTAEEERTLLSSLRFHKGDEWLRALFLSRMRKYDPAARPAAQERELEAFSELRGSIDALTSVAELAFYHNDFERAHSLSAAILARDSFAHACLPIHLSSLVELRGTRELFMDAHKLVDHYAASPAAWYAVGCYYFLIKKYDQARRHFQKATSLDSYFAPAWMGYGHTFAAQDETDQALMAYRAASRFFCGCHLPPLCTGMEHCKTGNLQLAEQFLTQANLICGTDPLVHNEMGVVRFLQHDYSAAASCFETALSLVDGVQQTQSQLPQGSQPTTGTILGVVGLGGRLPRDAESAREATWEATLHNLGHCYRKMSRFDNALSVYRRALRCDARNASTLTAIGFTLHLMGDIDAAVDHYHKALGICGQDPLTTDLLERALQVASEQFADRLKNF